MKMTSVILAGGKSSRFGTDKSLLIWRDRRIVEHLAEACSEFSDEILLVSNHPGKFHLSGIRELCDIYPGMGPLGGVHAGLSAAAYDQVFVTACDMPLFDKRCLKQLLELKDGYEAAVPRWGNRLQPLFSVLSREPARQAAEELLKQDIRKMRQLFSKLHTIYADYEIEEKSELRNNIFYNINYPADYDRLMAEGR